MTGQIVDQSALYGILSRLCYIGVMLVTVNSALAYTLWNRTLQTLAAVESSIINNLDLIPLGPYPGFARLFAEDA